MKTKTLHTMILVLCLLASPGNADAFVIRVELHPTLDEIDVPVYPDHPLVITMPSSSYNTSVRVGLPVPAVL